MILLNIKENILLNKFIEQNNIHNIKGFIYYQILISKHLPSLIFFDTFNIFL